MLKLSSDRIHDAVRETTQTLMGRVLVVSNVNGFVEVPSRGRDQSSRLLLFKFAMYVSWKLRTNMNLEGSTWRRALGVRRLSEGPRCLGGRHLGPPAVHKNDKLSDVPATASSEHLLATSCYWLLYAATRLLLSLLLAAASSRPLLVENAAEEDSQK